MFLWRFAKKISRKKKLYGIHPTFRLTAVLISGDEYKNETETVAISLTIVCSRSVGRCLRADVLRNGGMLILHIYFVVDGMPIEMYGESWITGLLTSDDVILYMAGSKRRKESNGTYCAFMA